MNDQGSPVVIAARRSPIATRGGRLARLRADELAAPVIRAVVDDAARATGTDRTIGDVILGNCMGPGGNTARVAALGAGLDIEVPGMTVDRQCGSGLSAVISAAQAISAGDDRMLIGGGVESASTAPARISDGAAYARAAFAPTGFPDPEMGPAAEHLAFVHGIDRASQDAYAARSHAQAFTAGREGVFARETVEIAGVRTDDGPRENLAGMLGRFPPLFPNAADGGAGTVTAGNSCRISDGAAAVALIANRSRASAPGLRLVAAATVGCDPTMPGIGPVAAVRHVLEIAGLRLDDIAAFELVEAFAAQSLAVLRQLGLADHGVIDSRVCANGGALALGHPWGASGAISVVRLFSRLVRAGAPAGSRGIATAAVGGGMGVAAVFEVVR